LINACWLKHPEKKKAFHSRGGGPPGAAIPFNAITISYLQAMISQAVDNVLASANTPLQFGRLCDSSPLSIHSSIPSTLATLSPFNLNDKGFSIRTHIRVYLIFHQIVSNQQNKIINHYTTL
jgi:hypothetical protein